MKRMTQEVSRLFLWGFEGTRLTAGLKRTLQTYPPAGLILFKRNVTSLRQLKKLISEIRSSLREPIFIGIDEEGGRVSRLPEPFTQYPPASVWGVLREALKPREGEELLRLIGRQMGRELAALGINLNFAPVLDVLSHPRNRVIGDRAFSANPKGVTLAAVPFAAGLLEAGVIPCGKHFPGHGGTSLDSHQVLPRLKRSPGQMKKTDLPPFQAAIRAGIPMLMTAHVVYPALDPKKPATLSAKILTELLRKKMGFKGVVISDDLKMKGISNHHNLLEASLLALEAGVDLLLIAKGFEEGRDLIENVIAELSRSPVLKARIDESLIRIKWLRHRPKLRS